MSLVGIVAFLEVQARSRGSELAFQINSGCLSPESQEELTTEVTYQTFWQIPHRNWSVSNFGNQNHCRLELIELVWFGFGSNLISQLGWNGKIVANSCHFKISIHTTRLIFLSYLGNSTMSMGGDSFAEVVIRQSCSNSSLLDNFWTKQVELIRHYRNQLSIYAWVEKLDWATWVYYLRSVSMKGSRCIFA